MSSVMNMTLTWLLILLSKASALGSLIESVFALLHTEEQMDLNNAEIPSKCRSSKDGQVWLGTKLAFPDKILLITVAEHEEDSRRRGPQGLVSGNVSHPFMLHWSL